jgi:hypothetical protein
VLSRHIPWVTRRSRSRGYRRALAVCYLGGDNCFAEVSPMHPIVPSLRRRTLSAAAGILLTLAPHVSLAQPVMSYALSWPGLTQDDIERMNAAGARLYEGRSIGTVERWRSPDSKDAGEVKLSTLMACRVGLWTTRSGSKPRGIARAITLSTGAKSRMTAGRSLRSRRLAEAHMIGRARAGCTQE